MTGAPDPTEVFDPERIVETLAEHRVRFVLVGGQAARFHGATRLTKDADVVVDQSGENLQRLSRALDELGWRLRAEGLTDAEAKQLSARQPMHPDNLRARMTTLMTDAGAVDILPAIPSAAGESPGRDYSALSEQAIDHQVLPGVTVRIASLEHIIESKQWAARPKDRQALPELITLANEATQRANPGGAGLVDVRDDYVDGAPSP